MTGFGIEIRFLSRSYAATSHHDWRAKEWPPHPARLFSAMVSEWAFAGESAEERRALEWLESQNPPDIFDPGDAERTTVVSFVPKRDKDVVDEWGATKNSEKRNKLLANIEKFAARGVSEARGKAPKTMFPPLRWGRLSLSFGAAWRRMAKRSGGWTASWSASFVWDIRRLSSLARRFRRTLASRTCFGTTTLSAGLS